MKRSIEEILEKIETNWNKRQGRVWRFRNKVAYNFIKWIQEKNVPKSIPNPEIDDGNESYSFFSQPNMQLGLPGENYATRVDYDGQIDTRSGKYHFVIRQDSFYFQPLST